MAVQKVGVPPSINGGGTAWGTLRAQVSSVVWSGPEVPALRGNDDGIHGWRIKGDISTILKSP